MTQPSKRFLIVDDDSINNLLTKMVLKKTFLEVQVNAFTEPKDALNFMKCEQNFLPENGKIILFLDINMPTMTGWEYLDAFEQFDEAIKNLYEIYILSSSVHPKDITRAKENCHVIDFLEKPLKKATIINMFNL